MNKETAVEWLWDKINKDYQENGRLRYAYISNVFEQAKEMEKQQIIDAYHINPLEAKWGNIGTDYYNETFNNNNNGTRND